MSLNDYYQNQYMDVMGTGLIGRYWKKIHKRMVRGLISIEDTVLEVGAGNGEFFNNTKPECKLYIETDIGFRENRNLSLSKNDLNLKGHISRILDAEDLTVIENSSVDVIVATCLFAHLRNPEKALGEWLRVMKPGGHIVIYVPCEPGLGLRLVRKYTTNLKFKKNGFSQNGTHWDEHIQHYPRMNYLIEKTFEESVSRRFYPLRLRSWDLNLYVIYKVQFGGKSSI